MNLDVRELYQELILDHNKHPRHCYAMNAPSMVKQGFNPLCGDKVTLYLQIKDHNIVDISFEGCGCAISQASASMLTDAIIGKTIKDAEKIFGAIHKLLTGEILDQQEATCIGDLKVLAGVCAYPARVKCATLAWQTLETALQAFMQ
jgi:nitrogen fixation NifU-like protein